MLNTITLDDMVCPLGFKVVTENMQSLGLRRNPNILTYPVQEWYILEPDWIEEGPLGWGGIWVARTLSDAKAIRRYMIKKHSTPTRIFQAALGNVLYSSSSRIKTDGLYLVEEVRLPAYRLL
jgi:hypothetical protein